MAVGETVVGTLWTSFAGICIEKLLDELLKVCSRPFGFRETSFFVFDRMESIRRNQVRKKLKKHRKQRQRLQHQQQPC